MSNKENMSEAFDASLAPDEETRTVYKNTVTGAAIGAAAGPNGVIVGAVGGFIRGKKENRDRD